VSRGGARARTAPQPVAAAKRPRLVWVVFALGVVGAAVLVLSALFVAGGAFGPSDADVAVEVSPLAIVLWGGLVVLAAVTWLVRRGRGSR
jgi:hypothetical protein